MSSVRIHGAARKCASMALLGLSLCVACETKAPVPANPEPPDLSAVVPPPSEAPGSTTTLESGLTVAQVRSFYHLSEGSEFVPYCALQVFAEERGETLAKYFASRHLIPDSGPDNPLALPIGLTEDKSALHLIGFNCAACHVGKISSDASFIVVGGPGSFNIRRLYDDLVPWLSSMPHHPKSAAVIAECLLSSKKKLVASASPTPAEDDPIVREASNGKLSPIQIWALIEGRLTALPLVSAVGAIAHTVPGPGRVDAFMTALNLMNKGAALKMDSPVAFPPLWGVSTLRWLHFDNDTNASLQRNMGQAIGVGAIAQAGGHDHHVIATSLKVPALIELEGYVRQIKPPAYPFAKSDPELVAGGRQIYLEKCASCHEPLSDGSMPEPSDSAAANPNTDQNRLLNFNQNSDKQINKNWPGKSLIQVLGAQLASAEDASHVPAEQRDKNPTWRITNRYGARTLHGVWASAPYLHNNSVPTLADLLKRAEERPKKFALDYAHYDTANVGFETSALGADQTEVFDTSVSGNSNVGHEFGTELSAEDKLKLIAYLKQL